MPIPMCNCPRCTNSTDPAIYTGWIEIVHNDGSFLARLRLPDAEFLLFNFRPEDGPLDDPPDKWPGRYMSWNEPDDKIIYCDNYYTKEDINALKAEADKVREFFLGN